MLYVLSCMKKLFKLAAGTEQESEVTRVYFKSAWIAFKLTDSILKFCVPWLLVVTSSKVPTECTDMFV